MIFGLVRMWFNDLSTEVPTGHRYLWASENKTIRNSEFLYETCFDDWHCISKFGPLVGNVQRIGP